MPVNENDYTKQAIIDRLERARQGYENAGNPAGVTAAQEATYRAEIAPDDASAREVELEFDRGDFGPFGGDDEPQPIDPNPFETTPNEPEPLQPINLDPVEPDTFEPVEHEDPEPNEPEHDEPEHDEPEHEEPDHDAPDLDGGDHDGGDHDGGGDHD